MPCCYVDEEQQMEVYHALQASFLVNSTPLPTVSTKKPLLFCETEDCRMCGNQISYGHMVTRIKALIQLRTETSGMHEDINDLIRYYLDFMYSEDIYSSRFSVFIK